MQPWEDLLRLLSVYIFVIADKEMPSIPDEVSLDALHFCVAEQSEMRIPKSFGDRLQLL